MISSYINLIFQSVSPEDEYKFDLGEEEYKDLKDYFIKPQDIVLGETIGKGCFGKLKVAFLQTQINTPETKKKKSSSLVVVKFLIGM